MENFKLDTLKNKRNEVICKTIFSKRKNFKLAKKEGFKWIMVFESDPNSVWVMKSYKHKLKLMKYYNFDPKEYDCDDHRYTCVRNQVSALDGSGWFWDAIRN